MRNTWPIGHGGDAFEGHDESAVGVGAAVLPAAKWWGEELAGGAVRLGDDGGKSAVGEQWVGWSANTHGVVVAGLVSEGSPLGGFVDGVRLQDETALGADGVPRRVVEDDLRLPLAVTAEDVRHGYDSLGFWVLSFVGKKKCISRTEFAGF